MKQFTPFFAVMMLLLSCSGEKTAVKQAAYDYSYAMANYDVDAAEEYATEETRSVTLVVARKMIAAVGNEYIASDTPATINILSVDIKNDTQAFAIYQKITPIKNFVDTLEMRKRDGEWFAHVLIPITQKTISERNNKQSNINNYEVSSDRNLK